METEQLQLSAIEAGGTVQTDWGSLTTAYSRHQSEGGLNYCAPVYDPRALCPQYVLTAEVGWLMTETLAQLSGWLTCHVTPGAGIASCGDERSGAGGPGNVNWCPTSGCLSGPANSAGSRWQTVPLGALEPVVADSADSHTPSWSTVQGWAHPGVPSASAHANGCGAGG